MATDTGTVELPTETTEDGALAEAQDAIFKLFTPETPQKPEEEAQAEPEGEQTTPETEQPSETQAETQPEAEQAEAEVEGAEDEEQALPEDVQARIDKRIAKVVAKRKELEEQLSDREAKLAEAEAKIKELSETPKATEQPAQPTGENDPTLADPEIKKLYDQEKQAEGAYRTASELLRKSRKDPDAVLADLKERVKRDFTDIEDARDFLEQVREEASVTRGQYATQRGVATQRHVQKAEQEHKASYEKAIKAVPALSDKTSKEFKLAQEINQQFPGLMNALVRPDGPLLMAKLVLGTLALEAKGAAPAVPKAPPPKLPTPGKTGTSAVTRPVGRPPHTALKQKAVESGDVDDVAKFLETTISI
jgi:hypothetical protein